MLLHCLKFFSVYSLPQCRARQNKIWPQPSSLASCTPVIVKYLRFPGKLCYLMYCAFAILFSQFLIFSTCYQKKHYFIFFLALTIFLVLSCISLTIVFIFLSTVPIKLKLLISKKQISFTFPFLASSIRPSIYEECTNCWKQERFASIVREKQRGEGLLENSVAINIHDDKTMLKPIIVNLSLITFWGPVTNLEN